MLEFKKIEIKDFINQYFYRYKILENELKRFNGFLIDYLNNLEENKNQNEDFLVANCLTPFLKNLGFETQIKSKMKGKSEIDLSIIKDSNIQIIIEAKKPNDKNFFSFGNPNCKALHETILYYFRIREENNFSIKYVILTDFYKFCIFESKQFESVFYNDKDFKKLYGDFKNKNSIFWGKTEKFYLAAKNILKSKNFNLMGTFLDLNDILKNDNDFKTLKLYFKIFSKDFLLQKFKPNDANELNNKFYQELLYLLGLVKKEIKPNNFKIKVSGETLNQKGTLYYNIAQKLGLKVEEEINEDILSIIVIWLNRILFLKLLEANLIRFNDNSLKFLNIEHIKSYSDLSNLFFNILAKKIEEREVNQI